MRHFFSSYLSSGLGPVALLLGFMLLAAPARAATIQQVVISESGKTEVKVRFVADVSPTFQVQEKDPLHFFVELPGTQIKPNTVTKTTGLLLQKSKVAGTRLDLFFNGAVDYDASVNKNSLTITFTHLGERLELERVRSLQLALSQKNKAPTPKLSSPPPNTKEQDALNKKRKVIEGNIAALNKSQKQSEQLLKAKSDQLANLQKSLDRTKNELAALVSKKKNNQAAVAKLTKGVFSEEKKLESLKKTNLSTTKANDELSKSVNALNAEIKRLNQKKKQLNKESETLKKQNAQQKIELASLKKKESIKESLAELNAQKDQASTRLATLGKDIDALRKESQKTQATLKAAQAQTQKENSRHQSLVAETTKLKAQADKAKRAQNKAQKDAQAATQKNTQAQKLAQQSQAKQKDAERALQKTLSAQKQAEQKRAAAERSLAAIAKSEQQKRNQLAALDKQIQVARTRPPARRQPSARRAPTSKIESAGRLATNNGFGGGTRSVTISKAGKSNAYVRSNGAAGDEVGRGVLSTITVQRDDQNGGRVGIRVDGGARYSIARASERKVVLTLFDTRAANLDVRRILDARSLGTKVLRVLPRIEEGQRQRVELTIELRDSARVRVGHDDSMLWLLVG